MATRGPNYRPNGGAAHCPLLLLISICPSSDCPFGLAFFFFLLFCCPSFLFERFEHAFFRRLRFAGLQLFFDSCLCGPCEGGKQRPGGEDRSGHRAKHYQHGRCRWRRLHGHTHTCEQPCRHPAVVVAIARPAKTLCPPFPAPCSVAGHPHHSRVQRPLLRPLRPTQRHAPAPSAVFLRCAAARRGASLSRGTGGGLRAGAQRGNNVSANSI